MDNLMLVVVGGVVDEGVSSSGSGGGDGSGSRDWRGLMHVVAAGMAIDVVVVEGVGVDVARQGGLVATFVGVDRSLVAGIVVIFSKDWSRSRGGSLLLLCGIKKRNLGHL